MWLMMNVIVDEWNCDLMQMLKCFHLGKPPISDYIKLSSILEISRFFLISRKSVSNSRVVKMKYGEFTICPFEVWGKLDISPKHLKKYKYIVVCDYYSISSI